jgi:hypothetical protein
MQYLSGMERFCAALLVMLLAAVSAAADSFSPGDLWPDDQGVHINAHGGGVLYDQGVYYWFGEHKLAGVAGNKARVGVHVYSSSDLYRWTDRGIALPVASAPDTDLSDGCILERPKVLRCPATGKFVMWFHLEPVKQGYRAARAGVAVANTVTGPYQYVGSLRPCAGSWPLNVPEDKKTPLTADELASLAKIKFKGSPQPDYPQDILYRRDFATGQMLRDMTLFADDDGTGYVLYASEENGTLQIAQLTQDYLKTDGKYVRVLPGGFDEAPTIFKVGGKYYLIASGTHGWAPTDARCAVADSIWGPWKSIGNPCIGAADQTKITFSSQGTFVLPVVDKPGAFIFMADRWQKTNAIDGRYVWLPILFQNGVPTIAWRDKWSLSVFDPPSDQKPAN